MPDRRNGGNDVEFGAAGAAAESRRLRPGWQRAYVTSLAIIASGCGTAGAGGVGNVLPPEGPSFVTVAMEPEVALAAEAIYRHVRVEIVFCLEARFDTETNAFRVTRAYLAPQNGNTAEGAAFSCAGASGYLHNHPQGGARACRLSATDEETLVRHGFAFAVGWCSSRRFFWALAPMAAAPSRLAPDSGLEVRKP